MKVRPDPIQLTVETPADSDLAWETITDPDRIAEWFTDASPLGRPGDPYRLDFGDSAVDGAVVSVDPGRGFAYTWAWEGQRGRHRDARQLGGPATPRRRVADQPRAWWLGGDDIRRQRP